MAPSPSFTAGGAIPPVDAGGTAAPLGPVRSRVLLALRHVVRVAAVAILTISLLLLAYGFRTPLLEHAGTGIATITALARGADSSRAVARVPKWARVAGTDGEGVALREGCADVARVPGLGIPEGAWVRVIETGGGNCSGWVFVEWEQQRTWVRDRYLSSTTP